MKSIKKRLISISLAASLLTTGTSSLVVQADSEVQAVIDEAYVQPDYVMGYSLDDSQLTETLELLSYNESQDQNIKTLTTDAYSTIMDVDGSSLQLYSSVKIEKLGASKGIEVEIVTPENITRVTEDMYRNAAITIGLEHAKITVAAPIAVTGESALAGIYYSLAENGVTVSEESKELASEELSTLTTINDENQGKEGYDEDKLNVALTDIKTAIANAADQNLTEEDVRKIVEDTLAKYELSSSMTENQINLIVNFAINLHNSDVILDNNFVSSLSTLKDSIVSNAKNTFDHLDLSLDTEEAKGFLMTWWEKIVSFFTNLFK